MPEANSPAFCDTVHSRDSKVCKKPVSSGIEISTRDRLTNSWRHVSPLDKATRANTSINFPEFCGNTHRRSRLRIPEQKSILPKIINKSYGVLNMASLHTPQAVKWTYKIRTPVGSSPYAEEENHAWLFTKPFFRFVLTILYSYVEPVLVYRTFT